MIVSYSTRAYLTLKSEHTRQLINASSQKCVKIRDNNFSGYLNHTSHIIRVSLHIPRAAICCYNMCFIDPHFLSTINIGIYAPK